jgi:oligopeptide transport system ATP-binding protein
MKKLLEVKNLNLIFTLRKNKIYPLKDISFDLFEKETLGIVGESGSGKTVCMQSLVKLLPSPPAKYIKGRILFEGIDLFLTPPKKLLPFRGKKIAYIFQDPMTSLNPTMKIGKQLLEVEKDKKKVYELLESVGIRNVNYRFSQYPFELSGGQRQRVMIAIALAMKPKILIADEPTTALDVTIQAQILKLLKQIQKKINTSIIFISHDIKVVANLADRILVMYGGEIIEEGPSKELIENPRHPYSKLLLESIPDLSSKNKKLKTIKGTPPDLLNLKNHCYFAKRCPFAKKKCFEKNPPFFNLKNNQKSKCWLYE